MSTANQIAFFNRLQTLVQENFDYASSVSVAKARLYIDAINGMLTLPADMRNAAGEQQRYDTQTLLAAKKAAEKWITRQNVSANSYVFGEYCNE